ncbi:MAG: hypothetical protein ACE5HA_11670 [Anaerolineae bacterium]
MQDPGRRPTRIKKRIAGQPIKVGERTIQPVAQVTGWAGSGGDETGGGAGAWLRVTPIEVVVHETDGAEWRVPITDPTREAMRGIVLSALLVAAVCWLITIIKEAHP